MTDTQIYIRKGGGFKVAIKSRSERGYLLHVLTGDMAGMEFWVSKQFFQKSFREERGIK